MNNEQLIMKKYLLLLFAFFALLLLSCNNRSHTSSVSEFSQWRGEGRDGVYFETGLLKEWPDEGPKLLWSYEGLGEGYTSVSIVNERLYVTGLTDENLILYVFDLNGNELTLLNIGEEWTKNYNGPRSTININDGKLYIYNALGTLFCIDEKKLEEVWKVDLYEEYGGRPARGNSGVNESPLIVGDKIFISPGGEENNIVALNKKTGELIWTSPALGEFPAYCSPIHIEGYAVPMLVTSSENHIIALNSDNGDLVWSFPQFNPHGIHPNTPLYNNGMILSSTGWGGITTMLKLTDDGRSVEEVWKTEQPTNIMGGFIKIGDYFYTSGGQDRYWYCVNWYTGEVQYREMKISPNNVIFADGMLYCYSERGEMALVKPNPEKFELISVFNIPLGTDQHWAHTVIHKGVLYVRHGDALMAYNLRP